MYTAQLRTDFSQGDVFDNVPVVDVKYSGVGVDPGTDVRRRPVMLISNDCDFDNKPYVLVAEIRMMTVLDVKHRPAVREGRSRRTFHVEEKPGVMVEGFVDFNAIHRIHKDILVNNLATQPRLLSLEDDQRLALQRSIAIFFGFTATA